MRTSRKKDKIVKLQVVRDESKIPALEKKKEFEIQIQKNLQKVYFESLKEIDDLLNEKLV